MKPFRFPYRSLAGGEISPDLRGRIDQTKYQTGLDTCRNAFVRHEGAATNRSGTGFIAPLRGFASDAPVLLPYSLNDDTNYVLVVGPTGTAGLAEFFVIKDGAPVFTDDKAITGITAANPPVVTSASHGLSNGDMVYITGVEGMTEVNNRWFSIGNVATNTFELKEEANVNGSGYTAYASGGLASPLYFKELPASWSSAYYRNLRHGQNGGDLVLVVYGLADTVISRTSDTNWSAELIEYGPGIERPDTLALSGTGGSDTVLYAVTAVSETTGEESYVGWQTGKSCTIASAGGGAVITVTTGANHSWQTGMRVMFPDATSGASPDTIYSITRTGATTFELDGTSSALAFSYGSQTVYGYGAERDNLTTATAANPVTISWAAIDGALEYNVYRSINGVYGYVGTSASLSFKDLGYDADFFDTPDTERQYTGTSRAVGFYQQRQVLTIGNALFGDDTTVLVSKVGLYENYAQSNPVQSNDGFSFKIAGNKNQVRHFLDLGKLLVFTQGAVFSVEGDDAGTLLPTAINARLRAEEDIGDVEPLAVNDVAVFVSNSGKVVRELLPDPGADRYVANDLTVFAKHLVENYGITRWTYAKEPYSIIWMVRSDGALIGCTYIRKHEVNGWHRHDTGSGDSFLDVLAIQESDESIVYTAVSRTVGANTRTYIERMASRAGISDPDDGRFFDSFAVYDGRNDDDTDVLTLDEDAGTYTITALGGGIAFSAADEGNAIIFPGAGTDGEDIICTIVTANSATEVEVTLEGAADAYPVETATWSYGVDEVSGLWHLEGRTVYALGDGERLGSFAVASGTINLGAPYGRICAGLQIVAQIKTLEPDTLQGETFAGRHKHLGEVVVRCVNTGGIKVGHSEDNLQAWNTGWAMDTQLSATDLHTGQLRVDLKGTRTITGQVIIQQDGGLPMTITGIYPKMALGE